MNYTVVWKPIAKETLAELWLQTDRSPAVTKAANYLDQALRRRPGQLGTVRFDTVRIVKVGPLVLEFELLEDDRMVWVLAVWLEKEE